MKMAPGPRSPEVVGELFRHPARVLGLAARLRRGRPPFPAVTVASPIKPINRTLRFVDSCVYAVGGEFIRRNLCRYTHTDVYMHPLCILTWTARVYPIRTHLRA